MILGSHLSGLIHITPPSALKGQISGGRGRGNTPTNRSLHIRKRAFLDLGHEKGVDGPEREGGRDRTRLRSAAKALESL